jgi:alpha-galactosidase
VGSSYRYFPLSRIGTDTRETWDWPLAKFIRHEGRPSAVLSLLDTMGRSFMNGTVYVNDPDVVFLRSENCSMTETEKECIALVNFLFAGMLMCSDNFLSLTRADLSFTKRINSLYDTLEGDEYGPICLERNVFFLESRSGKTIGLINLGDKPYFCDPAGALFAEKAGAWLVDHRLPAGKGRFCFAPRSVSIVLYDSAVS